MTARILVVDDNPLNVKLLAAKLSHDYYVVITASNGVEALAKIKTEKPDIVLLDIMMPELDGFETCKKMKADPATSHIPVIMVTALSDTADRIKGLEAGADDFLTKPINDVALMARVRSLLRLKMIMDEWRLREATASQFSQTPGGEAALAGHAGGHAIMLDDTPTDRATIVNTLGAIAVRVTFAGTVAEAVKMADSENADMVFASLDLDAEDGLQICPQLRTQESTRQLPIVLITNDDKIARVAKGLDLGANDYLIRPIEPNELVARTRIQLRHRRHYQRMRNNYAQNMALALVDPLTGAFNRRYLEAHVPKLFTRGQESQKPLSVLMIDIDHFKLINDTYGHAAGDAVLKEIVNRTMMGLRPFDMVARMGGEEFVIIMPQTNLGTAMTVAERLRRKIADTPFALPEGQSLAVTTSIGVASSPPSLHEEPQDVFKRADTALYEAKQTGRNRIASEKNPAGEVSS